MIPDFTYLIENADRVAGVFLTHGHADAIGALPYLVSEVAVPVFGTELTIELAKLNVSQNEESKGFKDFHVIDEHTEIDFGTAVISFFRTTHTIPDSVGISLKPMKAMLFIQVILNLILLRFQCMRRIIVVWLKLVQRVY